MGARTRLTATQQRQVKRQQPLVLAKAGLVVVWTLLPQPQQPQQKQRMHIGELRRQLLKPRHRFLLYLFRIILHILLLTKPFFAFIFRYKGICYCAPYARAAVPCIALNFIVFHVCVDSASTSFLPLYDHIEPICISYVASLEHSSSFYITITYQPAILA